MQGGQTEECTNLTLICSMLRFWALGHLKFRRQNLETRGREADQNVMRVRLSVDNEGSWAIERRGVG